MAKGIKSIKGNTTPEVGEHYFYEVSSYYPGTVVKNENDIKWKLYVKQNNNTWRELRGNPKTGKKAPFLLPERWLGKTMMIEAYMYNPEIKAAPGLIVVPKQAKIPVISKVDLLYVDNTPGQVFSFTEKLRAKAECVNMFGKDIVFTLWEDSAGDVGHNSSNKKIDSIKRPVNQNGIAIAEFSLTKALMMKAMEGEADVKQLEFYVTVEYYAHKKHPTNNVNIDTPEEIKPSVPTPTQPSAPTSVPSPNTPQTPPSTQNPPQIPTQNPTPSQGGTEPSTAQPEEPIAQAQANGTINSDQPSTPSAPSGTSPTVINEVKIEDVIDAYFAKKEYTKKTGEEAGTFEYKFARDGNNTATDAQKENIAKAIIGKSNVVALKDKKEYTTLEAIKAALTENVYNKDKTVTFKTFKLGEEFKKVSSAPLEDKLYLVAKTMLLDGKQATITIKEKDGIIKGSADAVLPVLEITEAQMEQTTPTTGAVQGSQKTEFTGTVKDNMVKIPIHLRPESDDELKQWKEKLGKGKEDGTYTYEFIRQTSIPNGSGDEKNRIAKAILSNAKEGAGNNDPIEAGKTAYVEDIESELKKELYLGGQTITFKLYKKEKELLYLNVKAKGEKQHDKNFLKQEGAYFEVGGKCICEARIRAYMRMLRVGEGTGEIIKSYDSKEKKVIYIPHSFDKGYTMLFGGGDFTKAPHNKDMSTHPNIKVYWYTKKNGDKVHSSASGAYQVMGYTWSDNGMIEKRNTYNIQDFSFENQDKFCIVLFKCKREGMLDLIIKGDIKGATETYGSYEWASLPPGRYGQPNETMEKALEFYEKFYEEELVGKSPLHIKSGFLKEFNIVCQCGSGATLSKNSKWHHPVDNPQLRGVYAVWAPERSIHSSNIPGRSKGKHDGIDLYAPQPTQIYACVDGEVNEIYVSETYGNCINIKGEYNGKTYWFFYAHLSSVSIYAKDGSGNPTKVKAGDPIGLSGKTGSSATALKANQVHLHFEVRTTANRTGGRVDPFVHISELNNEVIKNPQEKDQP